MAAKQAVNRGRQGGHFSGIGMGVDPGRREVGSAALSLLPLQPLLAGLADSNDRPGAVLQRSWRLADGWLSSSSPQ
ncbi:hypothetical protein ACVBEH_03525 [Roseateles sp. GG27B]